MPYTPTNWEDLPSVETPITAAELNRIEAGVDAAVEFADTHPGAVDPHTQYQKESEKGQAGGYASLDGSGTVPAAQIPAIAITTYLGSVADQSAMLALSGQVGDWAIRSDLGQTAIITGSDPTQLSSWTFLAYPASPVVSVNSETGAVVLDATDVGAEPAGAIATHESTYDHTDIPDPTGAAEQYVWTADGSGSASWQPGGGSAPTDSYWKFSNLTADADPGSGKFRFNDPLRSGTTFLYIDNTTLAGLNISNLATLLANGDQVFIQPKADAASRVRYTVTGPAVDGTGYWKIPVSVSVAATGSEISNNAEVLLLWNIAALGGTPSTHIHDDRYYTESEVDTLLSGKSSTGHLHDDRYYTESETDTLLSNKADLVGGLVPTSQIPAIAVTEYLGAAANQAAMLALVGQKGDFCTRTDTGTNWVITGNDPTQLADWTQLSYPTAPVTSVNSQTGAVVLSAGDVGAAPASHGTHLTDGDKGDITVGSSGTTFTIDNNAVTNAKAADMADSTIKGRASGGGTGDPQDLTGTQVAAILPTAATSTRGVVVPPGTTTTFLRGDGTWASAGSGTTWTVGSAAPTGGNDGDFYIREDGINPTNTQLYRKISGTWKQIGTTNYGLQKSLIEQGWSSFEGHFVPPTLATNDNGGWIIRAVSGTLSITGNSVNFAGSTADALIYRRVSAGVGGHIITGTFTLNTLPAGGTNMEFGCGNFWVKSFPRVTIDSTTKAVTFGGLATGVTAQVNDAFYISAGPGFGVLVIERGAGVIWNAAVSGNFYTASWGNDYGKCWYVGATGTLTAGQVTLSALALVTGGSF